MSDERPSITLSTSINDGIVAVSGGSGGSAAYMYDVAEELRKADRDLHTLTGTMFEQVFKLTDALNSDIEHAVNDFRAGDERLEHRMSLLGAQVGAHVTNLEEDVTDLANQLGQLQMKHDQFVERVVRSITIAVVVVIIGFITWALV